jgi:hypothetical protein
LFTDADPAARGAVGVGELAVLIEQHRQPVGGRAEFLGWQPARHLGQLRLGGLAGVVVDKPGQVLEELDDDLHVLEPDITAQLRGRGVRQHRC